MGDGFFGQVILGWPSNRADVDRLNQNIPPSQRFVPTIQHSLSTCDACDRGIWVGPSQRQLINSALLLAKKLCLYCASDILRVLGLDTQQVDLNLDIKEIPKRTA